MIYRYFFPESGGGWLRRYWQYRRQIARAQAFTPDGRPMAPLTLFDFTRPVDQADARIVATSREADGWKISDDRVIGGYSTSTAALVRTKDCWEKHLLAASSAAERQQDTKEKEETITPAKASSSDDEQDHPETEDSSDSVATPFLRWSGRLDTTLPLSTRVQRSGFCAIRSPEFAFDGADLRDYFNALELQCREQEGDPRSYTVNVAVSSVMIDDVYQGTLVFDHTKPQRQRQPFHYSTVDSSHRRDKESPHSFETFVLPFDSLRQTSRGRERELTQILDGGIRIESVGFSLMDGVNGDFQLDIARVRAVNLLDDGSIYEERPKEDEDTSDKKSTP